MGPNFQIVGGIGKPYYLRYRELRAKYDLTDKAMFECLIWLAIRNEQAEPKVPLANVVSRYLATAPSEMEPFPEIPGSTTYKTLADLKQERDV